MISKRKEVKSITKTVIKMGAVKGRHDMPVDDYILTDVANPSDMNAINKAVFDRLAKVSNLTWCGVPSMFQMPWNMLTFLLMYQLRNCTCTLQV